jgi:uncharacterized membrane protein
MQLDDAVRQLRDFARVVWVAFMLLLVLSIFGPLHKKAGGTESQIQSRQRRDADRRTSAVVFVGSLILVILGGFSDMRSKVGSDDTLS